MTPSPNLPSAITSNSTTRNKRNQPKSPTRASTNPRSSQLHQFFSTKKPNQNPSPSRRSRSQSSAVGTSTLHPADGNPYSPLDDSAETEIEDSQDMELDNEDEKQESEMDEQQESGTIQDNQDIQNVQAQATGGNEKRTGTAATGNERVEVVVEDASSESNSSESGIVHPVVPPRNNNASAHMQRGGTKNPRTHSSTATTAGRGGGIIRNATPGQQLLQ